jgi:hypothetical protein
MYVWTFDLHLVVIWVLLNTQELVIHLELKLTSMDDFQDAVVSG